MNNQHTAFIYNDKPDKYYIRNGRAFSRILNAYCPGHAICLSLKQIGYRDSTEISKNVLPLILFTVDRRGFRGYNEQPEWTVPTDMALDYFDRWMMDPIWGDTEFLREFDQDG